eukprot:3764453-Amphidinium_carterae.3
MAATHSPTTPEGLVPPIKEPEEVSMEDITKALKRKRVEGSQAGGSRASSAETALEKRLANERDTIPPPPRTDHVDEAATPCANAGTSIPASVPTKAAPKVPATLKDLSALTNTQTKPKSAAKKQAKLSQPVQPEEEEEPTESGKKVKKSNASSARIYACPLCPTKYESPQQRYLHCGLDHLVYIPMIEGAAQRATSGHELILVQLVKHFHHPTTNVPTYDWIGKEERKAFWSIVRNANKQNKAVCQGYVWQRLHEDNHIPTKLTPIPVEQKAEFHGEGAIRVHETQRVIQTRVPDRAARFSSTSWHSWRNPNQSQKGGWLGNSGSRKPVSPKAKNKAASAARSSKDEVPVIPIPDDAEPAPEQQDTADQAAAENEQVMPAVNTQIEPELIAPMELPEPVHPPQLEDPANRPTAAVTLQQSFNMINESWQCLAQHTYGAQHAGAILEARVMTLEQAQPKLMTDIVKRVTHVYERLNENDTHLGGQLNILKEDCLLYTSPSPRDRG